MIIKSTLKYSNKNGCDIILSYISHQFYLPSIAIDLLHTQMFYYWPSDSNKSSLVHLGPLVQNCYNWVRRRMSP